jgi:hypothetical protein
MARLKRQPLVRTMGKSVACIATFDLAGFSIRPTAVPFKICGTEPLPANSRNHHC